MVDTLARLFRHTVSYDKPDAILTKQGGRYRPVSSRELYRRVGKLRFQLERAGLKRGDRCALLSENRWEWAVADFACMAAGIVTVPIYPTLPPGQIHYLLEHSEAHVIMISSEDQLQKIASIWDRLLGLRLAFVFDQIESQDSRVAALSQLLGDEPLSEAEQEALEADISSVQPNDLASIIYTSGTTGVPKGVMLTHGNFASNVRDNGLDIYESDVCLSFLPLSHVAERTADYAFFYNGATVAYAESLDAVPENLREVRPTIAVGVPRFFEKVYARALNALAEAPRVRQRLFWWAVKVGRESMPYRLEQRPMPRGLRLKHSLADKLVYQKLRRRLGGRIRFFVSGSAPLPKHVAEFFFAVGISICEGYGLTETSPVISIHQPSSLRFGTVGKVIKHVEVKISEEGEILVRGPNVMKGYYKMAELTAETIADGWLHTGDLGKFDEDGYLIITDRKKDLLKTSGGKYIAPQPIENQIKTSEYVAMAVVVAEGRPFPSALIVPNFEQLERYAAREGLRAPSPSELARLEAVQELLDREVQTACESLAPYERVKRILVIDRELSIDRGEITPTLKVRRRQVESQYAAEIDRLYRSPRLATAAVNSRTDATAS